MHLHSDNEQDLLRRMAEGNESAFAAVYDRYYYVIYQYVKRWMQDSSDAEDITADTFVKLLRYDTPFESMDHALAFLKVTSRNACFNFLKHAKVKMDKQPGLMQHFLNDQVPDFNWLEIRETFLNLVYAEVDKMPEKMKTVFLLSFKDGLKPSEIAERLNLSVQTVSNHKTNAIRLLKIAFAGKGLLLAILQWLETRY